mmetsp:Transcript_7458/g.16345  ORF Transcript_7458/g.16345 Transcript_7458/m.16345 type:complete len:259 (-) Transcript_7458:311-1087(-)
MRVMLVVLVELTASAALHAHSGHVLRGSSGSNRMNAPLTNIHMGLTLHGSQQSRSPLVNWYAFEQDIPLQMAQSRPSNHPFGQVPFLADDGGVEIFESGAILLYLADKYGGYASPQERASYTKWVVWSNSELDGLCFGAVPGDHRVRGTSMDKPELRSVKVLDEILAEREWLVGDSFSVADVAIGAYLNYVPVFFPNANLSRSTHIAAYMLRCASRPAFGRAFGEQHAALVQAKARAWLEQPNTAGGAPGPFWKKLGL